MDLPEVSIIMPVFNGGAYLLDAVRSLLRQQPLPGLALPTMEIVVVDDGSNDSATLAALATLAAWPRVVILRNVRSKGPAGARNTGLHAARGAWVAFLDADDLWLPYALAQRWHVAATQAGASWVAGGYRLLRAQADGSFAGLAQLTAQGDADHEAAQAMDVTRAVRRLRRPVAALAAECIVIPTTVLMRRALLLAKGGFDERLRRAEDYHLWLRCALDTDLWLLPAPVAYYRIHAASLTHGDAPRFLHEDRMLALLLGSAAWQPHRLLLLARYDLVMQDHCWFYRGRQRHGQALRCALQWIERRPWHGAAWRELLASGLRRG